MLLDFHTLHSDAKYSLKRAYNPSQVILIHTGAVLLLSLLLTVADYLLNRQISTTGGLSGMSYRAVLTTVQSLLRLVQTVALPFWQIGYTYYILRLAQRQEATAKDLLEGFRRFLPVLRLKILVGVLIMGLTVASAYVSSMLFVLSPWSAPFLEEMEALAGSTVNEEVLLEAISAMTRQVMVPMMLLFGACFLTGGAFLFFRYRLAELWLMDHPEGGALAALRSSRIAMRGNYKAMLMVDLKFWWFYLLEVLISLLGFGDVILSNLGVELTTDAFVVYLLFFGLYLLAQLALYWWKRNEVCATYAHAYLTLFPKTEPEEPTEA